MARRCGWNRCLAAAIVTTILLGAAGCVEIATTAAYLIYGTDVDADYPGLKGKKVVVVCRPLALQQYRDEGNAKELASQIAAILKDNVSRIKVVEQRKVAAWCDEHDWQEYPEVGKALEADMVVGVDLTSFSTNQGPTLYQGKATASVQVFDMKDTSKPAWVNHLPEIKYPPDIGIPISDKSEIDFRRQFTAVLAERIARSFYAHDEHADVAQNARAGLN
jgi:hypothetical protein